MITHKTGLYKVSLLSIGRINTNFHFVSADSIAQADKIGQALLTQGEKITCVRYVETLHEER